MSFHRRIPHRHRKTFAPMLCYWLHGHEIENPHVIHFIDNMSVLSCVVMGSSGVADLSMTSFIACGAIAKHKLAVWFEQVESDANGQTAEAARGSRTQWQTRWDPAANFEIAYGKT